MNELELVRRECDAWPGPDDMAIRAARASLRHEIDRERTIGPARARGLPGRRRVLVALGAALAITAAVLVAALGERRTPLDVQVAAAAIQAFTPSSGDIVHSIEQTTVTIKSRLPTTTSRTTIESWLSSGPSPVSLERTSYGPGESVTSQVTRCGLIDYDAAENLFTVSPMSEPVDSIHDPVVTARKALRSSHIRYRGSIVFHGIRASRLVVVQLGSVTTYIVRRDNGYPLETIERRTTRYSTRTSVTTYSLFEHLAPTARNEQLVQLTPHPGAFYLRISAATEQKGCAHFGSLSTLTGRSGNP